MKPVKSQQQLPETFIKDIRTIIERGRQQAYAAAGSVMFGTNWEVGRRIVEEEQHGNARAQYGKQVIAMLANNLLDDYGSCYGQRNLAYYRQFYLVFSDLSILHTRVQNLTWSHIRRVLSVSNPEARVWYLNSAAEENWSVRTLGRNISSNITDAGWHGKEITIKNCRALRLLPHITTATHWNISRTRLLLSLWGFAVI